MDLIDRDELEDELQNSCNDYSDAIHVVRDIPTVDAIPLSVIDEIKAEIFQKHYNFPCNSYYDEGARLVLMWAYQMIDEKIKEYGA